MMSGEIETTTLLAKIDAPTSKEKDSIDKLRAILKPQNLLPDYKLNNDRMMLRYLQANKNDLKKAEQMVNSYNRYQKQYEDPTIMTETYPQEFSDRFKCSIGGSDKHGRPLFIIPSAGLWDVRKTIERGQLQLFFRYVYRVAQVYEKELLRRNADYGILMADVSGISIGNYCHKKTLEALLHLVRDYETNSPGCIGKVYLVNASKLGLALLNTVNAIIPLSCQIICFDSNVDKWKGIISKEVPDGHPHFGGTSKDFITI